MNDEQFILSLGNLTLAKEPQLHYEQLDFVYVEEYLVDLSFIREAPKPLCDKAYRTLQQFDEIDWDFGFALAEDLRGFIKNLEFLKDAVMEWYMGLSEKKQEKVNVDPFLCIPEPTYLPGDIEDDLDIVM